MMKSITNGSHETQMLEIGCGLGGFCIWIAKKGTRTIGLDLSSSAIMKAKDLAKKYKVRHQTEFIIGDAQYLPFTDHSNEIVVCSETLEHVGNYEKAFHELVRVTNTSGYICLTVPNFFSALLFQYIGMLSVGQPQYAKKFACVDKEHIFHVFKIRRLLGRENLKVLEIRSVDILALPPTIKEALKIGRYLQAISEKLEKHCRALRFLGATIGVLAKKE